MATKRTVRDFVRDLCRSGRTDQQVKAVALNTRWRDADEEIILWLKRRGDRWRGLGPIENIPPTVVEFSSTADRVIEPSIGKVKLRLKRRV